MTATLAVLIGGVLLGIIGVVIWVRATREKPVVPDPIATTTGSNRTLTGVRPTGGIAALDWDEALRRFVAYALDDAPREALSRAPDPAHAPVFKAVQQILETHRSAARIHPAPAVAAAEAAGDRERRRRDDGGDVAHHRAGSGAHRQPAAHREQPDLSHQQSADRKHRPRRHAGGSAGHPLDHRDRVAAAGDGRGSAAASANFPELVWEHTLYSATTAETHATQIENAEPFVSQLVGLLYGLSAIVVFRIVRDQFAAHPQLTPDPGSVARLLETWVAPTAGRIAASWELSAARAIRAREPDTRRRTADGEFAGPFAQVRPGRRLGDRVVPPRPADRSRGPRDRDVRREPPFAARAAVGPVGHARTSSHRPEQASGPVSDRSASSHPEIKAVLRVGENPPS